MVLLMLTHFVADFLLQSREMGRKKSTDKLWLLRHLIIIYACFSVTSPLVFEWYEAFLFTALNTLAHGAIDALIWKGYAWTVWRRRRSVAVRQGWNGESEVFGHLDDGEAKRHLKKNFKYWEDSWFYHTIGLDQFLHYITIVLLYGWLS